MCKQNSNTRIITNIDQERERRRKEQEEFNESVDNTFKFLAGARAAAIGLNVVKEDTVTQRLGRLSGKGTNKRKGLKLLKRKPVHDTNMR